MKNSRTALKRDAFFVPVVEGAVELDRICEELEVSEVSSAPPARLRLIEKSLETFVMLQFRRLTGAMPVSLVTSRPMRSDPDLVALDELGRVHVIELKKTSVNADDLRQAQQYMLRYGFADVDDMLADWQPERENWAVLRGSPADMATTLLLGLWANVSPGLVGYNQARTLLENHPNQAADLRALTGPRLTKSRWKSEWQHALLRGLAAVNLGELQVPDIAWFRERGAEIAERMGFLRAPPKPRMRSRPGLVLWVGAPSVREDALSQIRELRSLDVDVRAFECDVRLIENSKRLWVRLAVERADARADIESRVRRHTNSHGASAVHWSIYETARPSDRRQKQGTSAQESTLGAIRETPWAVVFPPQEGVPRYLSAHDSIPATCMALDLSEGEVDALLSKAVAALSSVDWRPSLEGNARLLERLEPVSEAGLRWGRRGVSLFRAWTPGVFVGFVVDGTDHSVLPSDPSKGVDLSVIVDVDLWGKGESYGRRVLTSGTIDALADRLHREGASRWSVLNVNRAQGTKNLWHPVHLRRPLVDIVSGRVGDALVGAIVDAAVEGVAMLTRGRELGEEADG